MDIDSSIHPGDARVIALMVTILAGLVVAIGFLMNDPSIDASRVDPVRTSHASMLSAPAMRMATEANATEAGPTTPEDNTAADESSHGLHAEAAH